MAVGLAVIAGCGPRIKVTPLEPAAPPVFGEKGMVVAAHPLAAQAGLEVLQEGGNAIDAALATLFMLNVVEPHASGLGGGGFALVRTADGEAKVVIYRERAAAAVDTAYYYDSADSLHNRMKTGGASVCVPGAAAGWQSLFELGATFPMKRLAAPAIRAARDGFIVDPTLAGQIKGNFDKILADSNLAATFLKDNLPYEAGDTLRQPDLARTLESLIEEGLHSFYQGKIAASVVAASQSGGGYIELEDLSNYSADIAEPLSGTLGPRFAGCEILTVPPPSSGGAALIETLNLIEISGALDLEPLSADGVHLMAQCIQQAYADAEAVIADPTESHPEWMDIIAPKFAQKAGVGITSNAIPGPKTSLFTPDTSASGNTTHLVVTDKEGNAVSLTQSINWFFGSGVMAPGTGIILNNQMADFSTPPDKLNLIGPRKRPRSNMTPLILVKNDRPLLVLGTPGGARIVAAAAQICSYAVGNGRDISTAIDLPRFFPDGEHLYLENRFSVKTLKSLKKTGYIIYLAGPYHVFFGGAHGIWRSSEGYLGAADKRRGGAAMGY